MPDNIVHKVSNLDENCVNLPKISDKVVFFPEEY